MHACCAPPHIHPLADIPEQRVSAKVVAEVDRDDINLPHPGDSAALVFHTAPTAPPSQDSDGGRRKVSATAIVTSVNHELSTKNGALRTVTFLLVATNGATDPVTITDAGGEA